VASRAGVSKASIYRRYPSKIALVADAAAHDRDSRFPRFDTGTTAGDLMAFVLGSLRMLVESVWNRVLPGVLAEAAEDDDVGEVVRQFWAWRQASMGAVVDRGIERGEIPPGTDPDSVLEMVDGPILFRLLVTRAPLDYAFADRLVDQVMRSLDGPWS
jgi:AcrR family transcriptional regulator